MKQITPAPPGSHPVTTGASVGTADAEGAQVRLGVGEVGMGMGAFGCAEEGSLYSGDLSDT